MALLGQGCAACNGNPWLTGFCLLAMTFHGHQCAAYLKQDLLVTRLLAAGLQWHYLVASVLATWPPGCCLLTLTFPGHQSAAWLKRQQLAMGVLPACFGIT